MKKIQLKKLINAEIENFIINNQKAFNQAVLEINPHFRGNIISRKQILNSIQAPNAESYSVFLEDEIVGGVIISIDQQQKHGSLDILYINVQCHSKGIGFMVWQEIEKLYPEVVLWETFTPYFEIRNLHFYINKCGFHMVEFFNKHHPEPFLPDDDEYESDGGMPEGFCRFEKRMK